MSAEPQNVSDYRDATSAVTAYHEAGHAVVAAALGQDVYWISTDEAGGCVRYRPRGDDDCPGVHDELAIVLAGYCAEAIAAEADLADMPQRQRHWAEADDIGCWLSEVRDRIKFAPVVDGGGDSDQWQAARIVRDAIPDDDLERALISARCRCREILAREWADVQAIVACLAPAAAVTLARQRARPEDAERAARQVKP